MRAGGEGSAITETVSATLGVTVAARPSALCSDHLLVVAHRERALQAGLEARGLEVVQQILGLVLEAQDAHGGADRDVGQRHAREALADDDRVTVRAGLGVADRREHALLEHRRHRVLQALGLLVDLVPGDAEHVGEEALDQAVAADDPLGVGGAVGGEGDRAVLAAGDVAVALEAADHLVDGRRRELHRARDVRAGHRQVGLLQPEEDLQVLLLGDGRGGGAVVAHVLMLDDDQPASWSNVHSRGGLSSRQRRSLAPWRMRPAETWSKSISITSSGRRPTHSRSLPALQRLGSAEPRSPDSYEARKPTSRRFSAADRPEQCPTTRSSSAVVEAEDQRADGVRPPCRVASRRARRRSCARA